MTFVQDSPSAARIRVPPDVKAAAESGDLSSSGSARGQGLERTREAERLYVCVVKISACVLFNVIN